jgi:serine/threonine protein kinase/tetratricopeptide (TPR) repeat protein
MIGKTISHYLILERLGGGGMGVVLKSEDTLRKRPGALKFFPGDVGEEPQTIEHFLREAQAASALDHPNICTIYEVGEAEPGQYFIVMACYEGETLKGKLERGPLGVEETIDIVRQIAAGLSQSHGRDIIHRDIKPGNIFITREGQVKILDFGLAKSLGDRAVTISGLTQGTPAYMAPERITGKDSDVGSDLWSVGVLFYEALTGVAPFRGDNLLETIDQIYKHEAKSVISLRPEVPRALSRLVQQLLRKKPDARLGSCHELLDALEAISPIYSPWAREGIRALGVRSRTGLNTFRRYRKTLTSVVLLMSLMAAALLFGLVRKGPDPIAQGVREPTDEDRTTLAILFFDNLSGEPELDWLRTGISELLVSDLSQSSRLNVLSTNQIHNILGDPNAEEPASPYDLARQVAERMAIDQVLVGTVAQSGERLRISVRLMEPESGVILTTHQVEDAGEGLLSMVDDLSLGIRQDLDIPLLAEVDGDLNLQQITTSSLTAWRFYSEGMRLHYEFKEEQAIPLFLKAVELDPDFSMAWAKLAAAERNSGHPEAVEHAAKALENAARLTPREHAYVEFLYYSYDVRTWSKASEVALAALERDPNHHSMRHNLVVLYGALEGYEEAIHHGEELLRRGYSYGPTYHALAECYAAVGQGEKGEELLAELAARGPAGVGFMARLSLGWLYRRLGQSDEALASFAEVERLRPGTEKSFSGRVMTHLLRGDWESVDEILHQQRQSREPRQMFSAAHSQVLLALHRGRSAEALPVALGAIANVPVPRPRAQLRLLVARILLARGDSEAAFAQAELAGREGRGDFTEGEALFYAALAEAASGDTAAAERFAAELRLFAQEVPGDLEKRRYQHLVGQLAKDAGDLTTAVRQLEAAADRLPPRGLTAESHAATHVPVWFSLATAYQAAGRTVDATRVFERLVDSSDERVYFPILFVRSLFLLSELYDEAGDVERARELRQRFLAHWDGGDLDLDRVAAARLNR